ncbi:MAG: hypothetical protein HGA45_26165 [Chloroflexales bacterium]|nr:hypothetical protein [Chloroflexales bacterium]
MNDVPRAEACASELIEIEDLTVTATGAADEAPAQRAARVLPRLAAIGARLAVVAPVLPLFFSPNGLGSGVRGC